MKTKKIARGTNGQSPNGRNTPLRIKSSRKIDLVQQADEIEGIFQKAVQHELSIHKRLGNPVASWRDGKVVIIPAEEIVLSPTGSDDLS